MAASGFGMAFKFDISLESKDFNNIIELTNERVGHLGGRVLGHGHIADGNLHLNTVMKGFDDLDPKINEECGGGGNIRLRSCWRPPTAESKGAFPAVSSPPRMHCRFPAAFSNVSRSENAAAVAAATCGSTSRLIGYPVGSVLNEPSGSSGRCVYDHAVSV